MSQNVTWLVLWYFLDSLCSLTWLVIYVNYDVINYYYYDYDVILVNYDVTYIEHYAGHGEDLGHFI